MNARKVKVTIQGIIGVIVLLLVITLWFSLRTVGHLKENLKIQVDTRTLIIELKDNLNHMLDAETGERGFIITGDTSYLEPYNKSRQQVINSVRQLRILTSDNPVQQKNLDTLESFINLKLDWLAVSIAAKKRGDEKAIDDLMQNHVGKTFMDHVRRVNSKMQAVETTLFADRKENTESSIARAKNVFISEGTFALFVTLFLAFVITRELNRRTRVEKKLRETNAELESKNKEVEQFAYVASHDLQEPLRTISNFSSLLSSRLKTDGDPKTQEFLKIIIEGTKRMSTLIFDLLEYSRIRKDATKERIDCNKMVADILLDMDAAIRENHARVTVSKLPVVYGYGYLKSVFQNLLSNALKFRKKDVNPIVSISATENSIEYIFTIKDNGIGIESDYRERIFLMFQRLHGRGEYAGTGIGLAQCRKIVELHGGRIWVESEFGKGSTFIFTILKS